MFKSFITVGLFISASLAFACPELEGRYPKCKSEKKEMKGEYIIDQLKNGNTEVYNVQYIDEDGDVRNDVFRTDGTPETRKEKVPTIGIKVTVESSSKCVDDSVVGSAKAFWLGSNVGKFTTKIYKENSILFTKIDGEYLGREFHKLIQCRTE